jgi:hypothetical protein
MIRKRGLIAVAAVALIAGTTALFITGKCPVPEANALSVPDAAGILHTPFYNFDQLPATPANEAPGSGGNLVYDPAGLEGRAGWRSKNLYPDKRTHDFFNLYSPWHNTEHMGFENYGYLEVDATRKVSGNSLRYVVTGGKNSRTCPGGPGPTCLGNGMPLSHKQQFLDYIASGRNPVAGTLQVGNPYLYFMNSSDASNPVPFREAAGANRLSFYIWAPETLSVGHGGYDVPPGLTFSFGTYSNVPRNAVFPDSRATSRFTGHWYHEYPINGGGWIKFYIETHPQHSNTFANDASFPFPSRGMRTIGDHYFNNLFRLYLTTNWYNGVSVPMFSFWIDEMEFLRDNEPQNDETINSIAVTYNSYRNSFEVGFSDKYTSVGGVAYATYELRYSFAPITNANWPQATPAHILGHDGFRIAENFKGRFGKNNNNYGRLWAPFRLNDSDHDALQDGRRVYFALKDVSQAGGNGVDPVAAGKGRDYRNSAALFDYAGDRPALPLIKRFDYTMVEMGRKK